MPPCNCAKCGVPQDCHMDDYGGVCDRCEMELDYLESQNAREVLQETEDERIDSGRPVGNVSKYGGCKFCVDTSSDANPECT